MTDQKQTTGWQPIDTAPRDGIRLRLLIPYDASLFTEEECTDEGYWDRATGCFRFDGDDGVGDIQPTHWKPRAGP